MNKLSAFIVLLMLIACSTQAQSPYFQDYFLLRKNEQVQVNAIFQDKTGFIWYGTNKGLFKFDGIQFKRFTLADSLPDENVTAIAQDSLGRIWTGHKNGSLAFVDHDLISKFNPIEGSAAQPISDLLFDRNGHLWFSTLNDGLYYFINDRLYRLDDADGMPDLFVYDLIEDQHGVIWAGTDGGLVSCRLNGTKAELKNFSYKQGLPDNIIKQLVADKDNTLWIATEDAGIIQYDPVSGKSNKLMSGDWSYGTVADFLFNGNQVWISSFQTGLIVYDRESKETKVYEHKTKTSSAFASINTLLKDQEGNVWIGSKTGLVRSYGDYLEYLDDLKPATDHNIIALTVDKEGSIWFSNNEGLYKRKVNGEVKSIIEQPLKGTAFQKYTIISLFTDTQGYVWAGSYGEGVLRIHPTTGKINYLNKELRNGNVLNITGKDNIVWLATLGGASRIEIAGEKLIVKNFSSSDGLISDYIYQVFIDSKDRVWFATDGKGADMFDGNEFHHYSEGLRSKVIYSFAEDGEHSIWANTQSDGLYQWNNNAFAPIGNNLKLRDNNIGLLSSDAAGNLVIMHDLGIDIYDWSKKTIRGFGDEAGMRERKPNLNSVARDASGKIFMGTDEGIIIYSAPDEVLAHHPQPNIRSLKIVDKVIPFSDNLRFSYDENNITINFLGFWFQNPEGVIFQYRLENYDRDWITSRDRFTIYSSLPPGDYTFRLKAALNNDFSKAKETLFRFSVHPPFWRTVPFYLFIIVAIIVAGYSYIKFRERQLLREKFILEAKVEERTQEIQKKQEEIMAQAEEIKSMNDNLEELVEERTSELERKNKALEEYAFITAHNLRAPVASILGLINLTSKLELKDDEKEIITHLKDSAEKLDNIVGTMTDAIEKGDS